MRKTEIEKFARWGVCLLSGILFLAAGVSFAQSAETAFGTQQSKVPFLAKANPVNSTMISKGPLPDVIVFADEKHPVTDYGDAPVFYVDQVDKIDRELRDILPPNLEGAKSAMTKIMKGQEGKQFNDVVVRALWARYLAQQFGVKATPAIVVDRKVIIYGVRDVRAAVDDLKASIAQGGNVMVSFSAAAMMTNEKSASNSNGNSNDVELDAYRLPIIMN